MKKLLLSALLSFLLLPVPGFSNAVSGVAPWAYPTFPTNGQVWIYSTALGAWVPGDAGSISWSGLTPNGLIQATSATTVASTLTPAGLTSIGVNGVSSAALSPLTLTTGTSGTGLTLASATGAAAFGASVGIGTGATAPATMLQVIDTATTSPRGITDDQYNFGINIHFVYRF